MLNSFSNDSDPLRRMYHTFLQLPPGVKRFCIALSGGLDSCVLLHATRQLFPDISITAIHVNHGLHHEALEWEMHCRNLCTALGIPLIVQSVRNAIELYRAQHSLEDAARKARYAAFKQHLQASDSLVSGHHLEDQAETILLHMMRGTGIKGLAGMSSLGKCGPAYHVRPLLTWTREERLHYAHQHQLIWVEDPSNLNPCFNRNFIRQRILPNLNARWPHSTTMIERMAMHCREATQLCDEVAAEDLHTQPQKTLSISLLLVLSPLRRRNALRYWLQTHFDQPLSTRQFQIIEQLLYTQSGSNAEFCYKNKVIKRYRDNLYMLPKTTHSFATSAIAWNTETALHLPGCGILTAQLQTGQGIRATLLSNPAVLMIRFRMGGERFHPKGRRGGSHPLKKLYQEWAVPPWERATIPLIYCQDELVVIPGYAVSEHSAASPKELGLSITISSNISKYAL